MAVKSNEELVALARYLCTLPERRSAHLGMIGYGNTKEGDRVLIAADSHYDPDVVAAARRRTPEARQPLQRLPKYLGLACLAHNAGEAIDDARRKLEEGAAQTTDLAGRGQPLPQQLKEKETDKERLLTLYR